MLKLNHSFLAFFLSAIVLLKAIPSLANDQSSYNRGETGTTSGVKDKIRYEVQNFSDILPLTHLHIADILTSQGYAKEAESHYREAISLCANMGNKHLESIIRRQIANAIYNTNPLEAFNQISISNMLADSLNEAISNQSTSFQAISTIQDEAQDNTFFKKMDKGERQAVVLFIIIFVLPLLLMAVLLGFAYKSLHDRKEANKTMNHLRQLQQDFFTKVAHELRTPLTVIIGLSDNIETGRASTEEELKKAAQVIKRNGYHMQRLTNQLLDLSKIKSDYNKMEWKRGDIVKYTEMIVESFCDLAKKRNISLDYIPAQKEAEIAFVPDYYNKVLYNLIANSLKYTKDGGHIFVSTSLESHHLVLSVTDTGIGIKKEILSHLFEEFYTNDQYPTSVSTGVGLALVKQIVDLLGGDIKVKSTEGKGTTFTITTPLREYHDDTPYYTMEIEAYKPQEEDDIIMEPTFDDDPENKSKPKILIVEDNVDVIEYIGSLLSQKYAIIYARDGEEGFDIAKQQVPDLIISDLMMPIFDGYELCKLVRSSSLLSHIPFIMITAKVTEEERIKGLNAGADAYLAKPFNPNVLLVRVEKLISQRQQLRELYSQSILSKDANVIENPLSENDQAFLDQISTLVRSQMMQGQANVESIASQLCLSSKQLRRKLYALTGETTVAYIMQIRLAEAHKMLMSDPTMPVSEVAMKCGFEDGGYFTKAFKQQYGMTPTQLRQGKNS